MATSEVAVCNLALAELGADGITALSDDSERARLCARLYTDCRNELIDLIHPNFAMLRAVLAKLVAVPTFGYDYAYQLPSDCLRALEVSDESYTWEVEGRTLVTNADGVSLRYLSAVSDATQFSPKFTAALVAYLAERMCYAITKSTSLKQLLLQQYEKAFGEALASEGAEGSPRTLSSTVLTDSVRI